MLFFKSKNLIGLDIGSSSIKMAEVQVTKAGGKLLAFSMVPTPESAIVNGEIVDASSLATAIASIHAELKTKKKEVATALFGTAVIVKRITMPKMDENLVKEQIRFEAEQYIPFDINNISIDFHVLNQSSSPETIDVLLIAAQNELVSQIVSAVEFARLKCEVLDVAGLALANCFEANYGKISSAAIGIFNIGSTITNFTAINNGEAIFTRDIPVGGFNYTNEIQKTMGVTFEEAEALKIDAVSQKEVPEEVRSIINSTTESIVEEVRNTIDFLVATSHGLNLSKCYYTGGASGTTGLIESLSRTIGIGFESFDPFLRIQPNLQKISPMYIRKISPFAAISVGLAYRMIGDS